MIVRFIMHGRELRPSQIGSLKEAVKAFEAWRDLHTVGASVIGGANVYDGGTQIAHISYNGRCWEPKEITP